MLENNEDLDKAHSLIQKAVKLKPNDGYIRDSLGWFYYKTGQIQKALVEVKKAFSLVNSDVVIAKHLAIIYKDLKKYKMAKKFFVEALRNCKFESERKDILKSLGSFPELRLPASEAP
jgi:Tfp pilus assembly protein PilF